MGRGKTPNVDDVRAKKAETKKLVAEMYERPVVTEPVVKNMISTVEVPNIWVYLIG